MKAMKALYAKYVNFLVEKRTLVEKSKIINMKPNCIYSMQPIEQHYYHQTEEQNSNGCKLFVKTLAKWILEFLGIPRNKGVNFHGKFGLGIPKHNNSGSKNLEIPRNSQKFQVYSQQDLEFQGILLNDFYIEVSTSLSQILLKKG